MASYYNISGELTQELLAAGDQVNVTSISFVNVHASTTCTVDLYVEKKLTGKFYIIKSLQLPVGPTLVIEGNDVKFSNKADQFGLYIKLTQGASETPVVDVIIN
tara:strand:+ start:941 stop:1252 length:312 start_codon:yes stop_codon:yes gene_type:complete